MDNQKIVTENPEKQLVLERTAERVEGLVPQLVSLKGRVEVVVNKIVGEDMRTPESKDREAPGEGLDGRMHYIVDEATDMIGEINALLDRMHV